PTVPIFPVDRSCLASYIGNVAGVLLFNKYDKKWVEKKAEEWDRINDPEVVITDMLNYVNFEIRDIEPFRY
ncbi:MAG TPA: hypothetical protein PKW79_07980, partial [Rhabdochlamydiaceae bacterium]|nr:hypothetical protein [Rhabdochlamydiaceae bacterium]